MLRTVTALIVNALLFTGIAELVLQLLTAAGPGVSPFGARSSILGALEIAPPLGCLALLPLASGLPTGRLASVSLGCLWVSVGAAPVFLLLPEAVPISLLWGGLRLVFVGLALDWILRLTGRPWLLATDLPELRVRSGKRIAGAEVVASVALPELAGGYGVLAMLSWM